MKNSFSSFSSPENKRGSYIPSNQEVEKASASFSVKQKIVLFLFILIGFISLFGAFLIANSQAMVLVPTFGGSFKEGMVGSPRFINPLFANSDVDRDLTSLIYSGLLRINEEGELIPDLAESYQISPDESQYTFTLKENLKFHDENDLTAEDVVFTIDKIKEEAIGSLKKSQFESVSVSVSGEREVVIVSDNGFLPPLENFTVGILPKHLWDKIPSQTFSFDELNTAPIGSGPYKIKTASIDKNDVIESFTLESFKHFALGQAPIKEIEFVFYQNEEALIEDLLNKSIDSAGAISPKNLNGLDLDRYQVISSPLPRVFGIFFNQNQANVLTKEEVRRALQLVAPKQKVIDEVLSGQGIVANNPFPYLFPSTEENQEEELERATNLLLNNGWELNGQGIWEKGGEEIAFSISTANTTELQETARIVAQTWNEFGAKVELEYMEISRLNQTIIRPRKYSALLFGLVNGRHPDPYSFWHSSQRLDPGLNIAMYANITADKLLSDLREVQDSEERLNLIEQISTEIDNDIPAIFLYSPKFVYLANKDIKNISIPKAGTGSERFSNIHLWYIKNARVWKIFENSENHLTKLID